MAKEEDDTLTPTVIADVADISSHASGRKLGLYVIWARECQQAATGGDWLADWPARIWAQREDRLLTPCKLRVCKYEEKVIRNGNGGVAALPQTRKFTHP